MSIRWEQVARAALHPTQVKILELAVTPPPDGVPGWSPRRISERIDVPFHQTAYHVRQLHGQGLLAQVGKEPVPGKGALEHFYRVD